MAAVEAPFSHFYSRSKVGYFEGKEISRGFPQNSFTCVASRGFHFWVSSPSAFMLKTYARPTKQVTPFSLPFLFLSSQQVLPTWAPLLVRTQQDNSLLNYLSSRKETNSCVGRFPHFPYLVDKKTLDSFFARWVRA